ncbi:peroxidasin-like protein [Sarcoptes scabiei]|uniref:Peroxidasin-like protein n=1 Tax=Sarcoptes scabiei TaxID=52283 RepID=A0A132AH59_SARSC|nr:peroxidasin-like protein [Sarcoptes scabiei]
MMTGMGDVDSFNPMLLPKRLASSIDAKMNLHLSDNEIEHAFSLGKDMAIRNWRLEDQLVRDGLTTNMSKISAVSRHQAVTTTLPLGNLLDHSQQVFEETSKILLRNLTSNLDPYEVAETAMALSSIQLHSPLARQAVDRCEQSSIHCKPTKYRSADGSCNNLQYPDWGKSFTCFQRLLPPAYADGQSAPRKSISGGPLPNPRVLSSVIHRDLNYPATYTHMVMQFGQFIAHDIAFTPSSRTKDGKMIQCCPWGSNRHPQCYPIPLPKEDPFYSKYDEDCMNFVRTAKCPQCKLGPRQQMNQITAYIDASMIYGSMENESRALWTQTGPAIAYKEWLPLIIGPDAMKYLKLNVQYKGYSKYDSYANAGIINEFSSAAFRFGHSLVNSVFAEILTNGKTTGYRLREFFFNPFGLYEGQLDAVLRGLISQAAQNRDPFITTDMKNHLYRPKDNQYGLDLAAFNIQRGRDHGIRGYPDYLKFCFDEKIEYWEQLDQYMPASQRKKFQYLYKSIYDVDLFSAGLAEYPLPGAAVGPTFTCIIGIQFYNLKYGDRFWFEHGYQAGSFTPAQLYEIRKITLAKMICANSDDIQYVQKNVFRGESESNPVVHCKTLEDTHLGPWKGAPAGKDSLE